MDTVAKCLNIQVVRGRSKKESMVCSVLIHAMVNGGVRILLKRILQIDDLDELFKKADEEHAKVQQYYDDSQKKHEEYIKLVNELSVSISESNKKHEQYIEVRNEAQKNHEKAVEMRSKVVAFKDDRMKRWKEAKMAIKEQNIKARKATMDKEELQKYADKSVDALKKGEKISL